MSLTRNLFLHQRRNCIDFTSKPPSIYMIGLLKFQKAFTRSITKPCKMGRPGDPVGGVFSSNKQKFLHSRILEGGKDVSGSVYINSTK